MAAECVKGIAKGQRLILRDRLADICLASRVFYEQTCEPGRRKGPLNE